MFELSDFILPHRFNYENVMCVFEYNRRVYTFGFSCDSEVPAAVGTCYTRILYITSRKIKCCQENNCWCLHSKIQTKPNKMNSNRKFKYDFTFDCPWKNCIIVRIKYDTFLLVIAYCLGNWGDWRSLVTVNLTKTNHSQELYKRKELFILD